VQYVTRRQCLGDLLRRSAARAPAKTAIICGTVRWSYARFDRITDTLAAGLQQRGIAKGSRVAILARNSHAFAAMRFALARLGAVLVPVNYMLKATEVAYILSHAGTELLATDASGAPLARAAAAQAGCVRDLLWMPAEEDNTEQPDMLSFHALADCEEPLSEVDLDAHDLAQIVYTSGTESLPKGAMLTHDAVLWEYVSCIVDAEIAGDDVMLHALPLFHCAQLDVFLGPSLYVGATNIITGRPSPDTVLPLIAAHAVNSFFAPPTVWISLLRHPDFDTRDLTSLEKIYYGASIMPVPVLEELRGRLPRAAPFNLYGQSEIGPLATVLRPEEHAARPASAGRPVLNVETRIVDAALNDVPPGTPGEVVHRSPQLMIGYWDKPDETAEAFAGGWFHSGDVGTRDAEGYITITDRIKDVINTGGVVVSSREVEDVLFTHPAVSEAAVIALPHPKWVEAVAAIVVLRDGMAATEDEVIGHAHARLAPFKVPKRVFFSDAIPRNTAGKVLKRVLREEYASRASF
jgi:fatty-acyl-CoA synthase